MSTTTASADAQFMARAMSDLVAIAPALRDHFVTAMSDFAFYYVRDLELGNLVGVTAWQPGYLAGDVCETDSVYGQGPISTTDPLTGERIDQEAPGFAPLEQVEFHIDLPVSEGESVTLDAETIRATKSSRDTQRVDYHYDHYNVVTEETCRGARTPVPRGSLRLSSENRVDWCPGRGGSLLQPLAEERRNVPPPVGRDSLVVVILDGDYARRQPRWFVASFQLLRFWTLVIHGPSHPSFDKHRVVSATSTAVDETRFRRWLASSINLTTNGYRKWTLGYHDHGLSTPVEERLVRETMAGEYTHKKEEWSARSYCHIYLALTWLLHYQEVPTAENLPRGILEHGDQASRPTPPLLRWDLPPHFARDLLALVDRTTTPVDTHLGDWIDAAIQSVRVETEPEMAWFEDTPRIPEEVRLRLREEKRARRAQRTPARKEIVV